MVKRVNFFTGLSNTQNLMSLEAQINCKSQILLDLRHKLAHNHSRSPILLVLVFRTALLQNEPQILDHNRSNLRFFPFLNLDLYVKSKVFYIVTWASIIKNVTKWRMTWFFPKVYWVNMLQMVPVHLLLPRINFCRFMLVDNNLLVDSLFKIHGLVPPPHLLVVLHDNLIIRLKPQIIS